MTLDCFFNFKSFVTRFNFNHPSLGSSMFFPDLLFPIVGTCHFSGKLVTCYTGWVSVLVLALVGPSREEKVLQNTSVQPVALKNATGGKGWTGFCLAPTGAHKIRSRAGGAWRRVTCKFTGGETVKGKGVGRRSSGSTNIDWELRKSQVPAFVCLCDGLPRQVLHVYACIPRWPATNLWRSFLHASCLEFFKVMRQLFKFYGCFRESDWLLGFV